MEKDYKKAEYYENRELSWLGFDERILGEARDKTTPLFERLKFLSITASNLDEFFMVRVASLKDMVNAGYTKKDLSGMTPEQQLDAIHDRVHSLVNMQYSTWQRSLLPGLRQAGLCVISDSKELSEEQKTYVDHYFMENVYPVLTPMAVDSSRPFPLIVNKTLNLGALLKKKGEKDAELEFATVQVPSVLPRIISIPAGKDGGKAVILLEDVIAGNMDKLFLSYDILCVHPYRIMRNADLTIDEDEASDLLEEIQKQLKKRQWGEVIRLEVDEKVDKRLLKILKKEFAIKEDGIYRIGGPLDLTFLMKMYGLDGFDAYKTPKYTPQPVPELNGCADIFEAIRKGDILMHHPYQTFDPVVDFVRQAAKDKDVLAIKQTLYRVSGNSPIIAALAQAAENGKQVSVLVELKARFDEENNIEWSRRLEDAGCHVVYGIDGLKVHSKVCLITRKDGDQIQYITQIGTGNYNEKTARLYTDLSLITANQEIGEEALKVFQAILLGKTVDETKHLLVAPKCLQKPVLDLIDREIQMAKEGKAAYIGIKINSLTDKRIIDKLVEASKAGVKIDMVVRGICCLRSGVLGETEHIHIRSIVGRYLEHSRIYIFGTEDRDQIYIASADFMTRNTLRRVEVAVPVYDEKLKCRIREMFQAMLKDNVKARVQQPDGTYRIEESEEAPFNSQEVFFEEAYRRAAKNQEEPSETKQ